ncbi:hypothetical protein FACS189445_4300 [Spirochaetia bacterium]|nr:hypothetical protein FACS189445_4300 [Spirochaetia bacterium]
MEESKTNFYKNVIGVGGLLMCLLFFSVPLVTFRSVSATGWNFVAGGSRGMITFPAIIFLLIGPAFLSILAFLRKSFKILSVVSAICLVLEIAYFIVASSMLSSWQYGGEITGGNWFILLLYIGLCGLSFFGIKNEKQNHEPTKKCPFCANDIKVGAIICQFCGKELPKA